MRLQDVLLALSVTFIWGAGFSISKLGVSEFPPMLLLAIRFLFVGLFLLPFCPFPYGKIKALFYLSLMRITAQFSFLFIGLTHTDASLASILILTEIPLGIVFSGIMLKESFSSKKWLALSAAFISAIMLSFNPTGDSNPLFCLLIFLSALSFVISCVYIKKIEGVSTLSLICYNALMAVPQLSGLSLLLERGQLDAILNINLKTMFVIIYLVIFLTIFTSIVWITLIKKYDFNKLLVIDLMTPIFGIISGIVTFGEKISFRFCVLSFIIISCILYINRMEKLR